MQSSHPRRPTKTQKTLTAYARDLESYADFLEARIVQTDARLRELLGYADTSEFEEDYKAPAPSTPLVTRAAAPPAARRGPQPPTHEQIKKKQRIARAHRYRQNRMKAQLVLHRPFI